MMHLALLDSDPLYRSISLGYTITILNSYQYETSVHRKRTQMIVLRLLMNIHKVSCSHVLQTDLQIIPS